MDDLIKALNEGECEVTFKKKDGSERTITATLNLNFIPEIARPKGSGPTKEVKDSPTLSVYETELGEWRSFTKANLISWQSI